MTLKTILFGAASALVLSAGAANAVPATAETSLNVRSGPGTQYEVVGAIPAGETVDVRGCTGSWCRVAFAGGTGFASRSYLAIAGGPAPSVGVAVAPGYAYDDGPYYDDYYDYGYAYGPSVGFAFGGGRDGFHHRGNRGWDRGRVGTWSGGNHWNGHTGRNGNRVGGIQGRGIQDSGARQGFAGPPASWQRPGTGIGAGGAGRNGMAGASVGMRNGGGAIGGGHAGSGGGHAGGGAPGGGFAGSIAKH